MITKTEIKNTKPNVFDILYFCFFLLLPLIYFDQLVDPVLIPRQIFLTVFVFIIGSIICYQVYMKQLQADFSFMKLYVCLFFLFFVLTIVISFFQSIAISESIYLLSKISIEILFFIISTYLLIQNKLNISSLIKSIIVVSLIIVSIAVFQLLKLSFSENNFFENILKINSTFANKNLLASILFLTFPFILNSFVLQKPWKIISAGSALSILILIWLIQTRAVFVAFFVFFLILLFLLVKYRKDTLNKRFIKVVLISVSSLLLIVGIITIQNKQEFSHTFSKTSAFERFLLWENSAEMIKENFVFGVGAGNWQVHFPKYGLDKFHILEMSNGLLTFQRPHNDFLWVFCEMGIIGLLVYISIFFIVLYYFFKLFKKFKERNNSWLYSVFFAAIIGYLTIAFVDFPLERIEHQLLLYLMFSIITAHFYTNFYFSKASRKTILKLPVIMILFFTPVLFSFVVSFKRCSGEYHTHKLYYFHNKANWDQMIREADKARNYCYSMDPTSAPIEWYKGVALFASGNISSAKTSFEQAYAIHPYNIHVLNNLASCYESLNEHKKAEKLYLNALSISSEFEETRLNLSAVYYNMKEYENAFKIIDKCSINSTDPKYKLFLPVILNSLLDDLLSKQKDTDLIITDIKNTKDKITQLYFESKIKGVNFEQYVFKQAK